MDYHQITLDEYLQMKDDLRRKLNNIAESFVYIGYRLKQIRDMELYRQDGFENINDFAQQEYGLSQPTVSRFIAINDKYSLGGNSLELAEEYQGFGSSRLSEMLTLSDEECRLITKNTKIADIRELKRFGKEPPIESFTSEEPEPAGPLEKLIIEFFRKPQMHQILNKALQSDSVAECAELINPNGNLTFRKGVIMLFLYDEETGLKYKKMGDDDIHELTWEVFIRMIRNTYQDYIEGNQDVWEAFYGKEETPPEPPPIQKLPKPLETAKKDSSKQSSKHQKSKETSGESYATSHKSEPVKDSPSTAQKAATPVLPEQPKSPEPVIQERPDLRPAAVKIEARQKELRELTDQIQNLIIQQKFCEALENTESLLDLLKRAISEGGQACT